MQFAGVIVTCFPDTLLIKFNITPYGQKNLQYGLAINTPNRRIIAPAASIIKLALSLNMPTKGSYLHITKSVPVAAYKTAKPK